MKILGFTDFFKFEKLNKSSPSRNSNISSGDAFSGKVVEAKNQSLVVIVEGGKLIKVLNEGQGTFNLGDEVDVKITETGDPLKAIVTEKEIPIKLEEEVNDKALKNLGIIPSSDKKEIAKLLKMNSIPVTKENLETVSEEKKFISKLSGLIKENLIDPLKLDINKNVKSVLVDHINNIKDNIPTKTEELKLTHIMLSEKNIEELLNENLKPEKLNLTKSDSVNIEKTTEEVKPVVIKNIDESEFQKPSNVSKFLTEKLDKVDYKSIVFNLKNNIENTIKNIIFLDKIVLGNDSVYKQIERFSKNLKYIFEKNGIDSEIKTKIFNMVKDFTSSLFDKDEKIEELGQKIIKELESSNISSIEKAVLKSEILTVKNSVNYINTLSDKIIFMQMPVIYNDEINNMDLYVKKKNGKEKMDPDNCSVYISLDTQNLDTVKSYIEIKKGKVSINFKLAEENIKSQFDENKRYLLDALEEKGFKDVAVNNNVVKVENPDGFIEDIEEIFDERIIDVKL